VAEYIYNISEIPSNFIDQEVAIKENDSKLIEAFTINSKFNQSKHRVDLFVYSLDNQLLEENTGYTGFSQLLNSAGAGQEGTSNIVIDPEKDIRALGYENSDVRLLYTFNNNLFTDGIFGGDLFVEDISTDRTEFRALSINLTSEQIKKYVTSIKSKLNDPSYFSEFKLNFGNNTVSIGLNIDFEDTSKGTAVVFKVYEGLPASIELNSEFAVEEIISDSRAFEIITTTVQDEILIPKLKGPNFQVELAEGTSNSTDYFNYNELFSYPVTSSNFKLYSLVNEKGANIAIRYDSFSNFIHFSSAEERLRNFQYKLALLESYENNLDVYKTGSISSNNTSGSRVYYENLISGVINNFDHYDRFLYYGSGSHSWPKQTSSSLEATTSSIAESWFEDKLLSASTFDNTNYDALINTIPTFIREDSNNENYLMFTHMIGQHFDNIWVYIKAMSDRYDTDHRLDFGISKDLIRSAIESFGVKLYNSNQNLDNIFSMLVGETPSTGSEKNILSMSIATSASFNSGSTALEYLQPVAKLDYEQEVYKRIYHNLPYLTKTKGTERGLRALINCFGIPFNLLSIKQYGGAEIDVERFFGPEAFLSSSISESFDTSITTSYEPSGSVRFHLNPVSKVRIDNTGSVVEGNTLSRYVSINKKEKKYTDDSHQLQVGFNISRGTNEFIDLKVSGSFDIDNYIGDPRDASDKKYHLLTKLGRNVTNLSYTWEDITTRWEKADWNWDDHLEYARDPKSFIRLLNFFDSSLFRIIKDFVPARAKVDTGIIIESHKLARSKAQQPSGILTDETKSGSLSIASITGSQGGSYDLSSSFGYTTNYSSSVITPLGVTYKNITDESPMYNGEFSGSLLISTDGEVGRNNPFIGSVQPIITFDLTLFNLSLPPPAACILILSASYQGEFFQAFATGSVGDYVSGSVQLIYPTAGTPSENSIRFSHTFDDYEFFTLQAEESYLSTFRGWYTQFPTGSGDTNKITSNTNLTIYYTDENTYGNSYYAVFDP